MPDQSQIEKFRAKAHELECSESEEAFERKLKKIANAPTKVAENEE